MLIRSEKTDSPPGGELWFRIGYPSLVRPYPVTTPKSTSVYALPDPVPVLFGSPIKSCSVTPPAWIQVSALLLLHKATSVPIGYALFIRLNWYWDQIALSARFAG
jgi:hypothetical protein